jgi:hypothetical protein
MSDSSSLRAIAQTFRLTGWISFWTQVVLGVVSAGILISTILIPKAGNSSNPGTGFGIVLAVSGLITLGVSIYLTFRYTRIARQLESSNPNNRPRKIETIQSVRLGVTVNLVGILLTLFGAQAINGNLILKALTLPQFGSGLYTQIDPNRIIQPLDIFVVQANTNTVSAHFAGLVGSIWLLNRLTKS